jgi:FAD/FMN-containing dehydrogenase
MTTFYMLAALCAVVLVTYYCARKWIYSGDVAKDAETLAKYSRDISIFAIEPEAVYFPKTVKDVVYLVERTAHLKKSNPEMSVTVRAGGTCMSGGSLGTGAVIDMTRYMNSVVIDSIAKTATVGAGAYFRDIEDAALKHGLMFAPYPSSRRICGIGGMIGNNASGEKSIRFGATSDNILEMEVVLADGTVTTVGPKSVNDIFGEREKKILALAEASGQTLSTAVGQVKKAASGYRLDTVLHDGVFNTVPLFCGAQGTLGIVTKAVLKLVPIPAHLSLLVISASNLEDIPVMVDTIFKWHPEAIETFDTHTFAKAREHLTEHANRLLPYVDENANLFMLAEFGEETKEATDANAASCFAALQAAGYRVAQVTDETDAASIWEVRRNSFLLMRDHNPVGFAAVPCIEDVIVPVSGLAQFIKELGLILERRNIHYGFHGHIGDGSLRIVPVFDTHSPTLMDDITGLMTDVFAVIKRLHGNISADHSDGIIRTPFLAEFYGEELTNVFKEIKHIYDPLNVFNPGKKVGFIKADIGLLFDQSLVK